MLRNSVSLAVVCFLFASEPVSAEEPQVFSLKSKLTYGMFGPLRSTPVVAGDKVYFAHTVSGLTHDGDGYLDFSTRVTASGPNGEVSADQPPIQNRHKAETTTYPVATFSGISAEAPAGIYVHKTIVTDNVSGRQATTETRFEVEKPKGVTLYQLKCGNDTRGQEFQQFQCAGATIAVGDILHIDGVIANFTSEKLLMKCKCNLAVLDLNGRPVKWGNLDRDNIEYPQSRYFPETVTYHSSIYGYTSGRFILRIHFQDLIGKTETTEYLPFQVLDSPDWSMPKIAQKKQYSDKNVKR